MTRLLRTLLSYTGSLFISMTLMISTSKAQEVVDQVVTVVGGQMILLSDVEQEVLRMRMQGELGEGDVKCEVFEDMLIHKLLIHHAHIDSITVNEMVVEGEMERRLNYFINQIGSEAALEDYFNKPIYHIKDDMRKAVREMQLSQQMRQKIVEDVMVTPSEVKRFFHSLPTDSIPTIPQQYEYRQIVVMPPESDQAKYRVREQLLELRERVLKGERFSTLAVAYSEDRGSAARGGELGFRRREELVKSFADVAFNLREGQVSQIVESEYGYHIIQMIERRGDQVNVRHILMRPSYTSDMIQKAYNKLDSIATLVRTDSLTFRQAARMFSEDDKTRLNGGLVPNPQTGTSLFEQEQIMPADFYTLRNLTAGEVSKPFESRDRHANTVYKITMITRIIPTHKANLDDDYAIIQNMARGQKEYEKLMEWVGIKQQSTYIRIEPSFANCKFEVGGWIQ